MNCFYEMKEKEKEKEKMKNYTITYEIMVIKESTKKSFKILKIKRSGVPNIYAESKKAAKELFSKEFAQNILEKFKKENAELLFDKKNSVSLFI